MVQKMNVQDKNAN